MPGRNQKRHLEHRLWRTAVATAPNLSPDGRRFLRVVVRSVAHRVYQADGSGETARNYSYKDRAGKKAVTENRAKGYRSKKPTSVSMRKGGLVERQRFAEQQLELWLMRAGARKARVLPLEPTTSTAVIHGEIDMRKVQLSSVDLKAELRVLCPGFWPFC